MKTFIKDPDAVLDYQVDWSAWLGADTISSSSWIIPAGITKDSDTSDDATATAFLSGGDVGASYKVTNRIVTAGGRTDDRSIIVNISNR